MDTRALLAAFRLAIDKEIEAAKFYADLARNTDDPEMKTLFQRFANEEQLHADEFEELYSSLKTKTQPEG